MATPKQKTHVRREQIARAALGLIARGGPSALSVTAVAREVGLTPSGLYRHYAGRDEIVDAALALVGDALRANLRALEDAGGAPLARLRQLHERHVALVRENPGIPRLVFSEETYGNPQRSRDVYSTVREYLAAVADLVEQAQQAGEVRSEVEPSAAATLFLGIIQPQAVLWHMSGEEFSLEATTRRAWQLLESALVAGVLDTAVPEDLHPNSHPRGE